MGGRKLFVTVTAGLLLALISLPAYGATFGGTVNSNTYADRFLWGYDDDEDLSLQSPTFNTGIESFWVQFYNSGVAVDDLYFDYSDGQVFQEYPHILANNSEPIGVVYYSQSFDSSALEIEDVTLNIYIDGVNTVYKIYGNGGELIAGSLEFTPIPIPSAMWLLGSGLACLVGLRRRFRTSE